IGATGVWNAALSRAATFIQLLPITRKLVIKPGPAISEHPATHDHHDPGADECYVRQLARQERRDVRTEELRIEEKPEAVAPDNRQQVEQEVDKARKNSERSRQGYSVQHVSSA